MVVGYTPGVVLAAECGIVDFFFEGFNKIISLFYG